MFFPAVVRVAAFADGLVFGGDGPGRGEVGEVPDEPSFPFDDYVELAGIAFSSRAS